MSLRARRVSSWAGTLTAVAVLAWLSTRMPGSGGLPDELRWLLAQPPASGGLNRAFALLVLADEQTPGVRATLIAPLLRSADPAVVDNTLRLLTNGLTRRYGQQSQPRLAPDIWAAFEGWFDAASDAEKQRHRKVLADLLSQLDRHPDILAQPKYHRWLVAETLRPLRGPQAAIQAALCGAAGLYSPEVGDRLRVLDGQAVDPSRSAFVPAYDLRDPQAWPALPAERVAALVDDPIREIRWAAGRILTVCRDPRGLPALAEWLRADPTAPAAVREVTERLFGREWRTPFESGATTSQPGARDGR